MSRSELSLSLATGAVAPLALLLVSSALSKRVIGSVSWKAGLFAAFLAVLGLVLWPPIRPVLFGSVFAVACPLWYTIHSGGARTSNLFGLALILLAAASVLVTLAAVSIGVVLRRFRLPTWTPAAPLIAAIVMLLAAGAINSKKAAAQYSDLTRFMQRLDVAESSFAAGPPFRGFTCNGPDLTSITGIDWHTDDDLGGTDRNKGTYAGYWITLWCAPSAQPSYYSVTATPISGIGEPLTYDSRKSVPGPPIGVPLN